MRCILSIVDEFCFIISPTSIRCGEPSRRCAVWYFICVTISSNQRINTYRHSLARDRKRFAERDDRLLVCGCFPRACIACSWRLTRQRFLESCCVKLSIIWNDLTSTKPTGLGILFALLLSVCTPHMLTHLHTHTHTHTQIYFKDMHMRRHNKCAIFYIRIDWSRNELAHGLGKPDRWSKRSSRSGEHIQAHTYFWTKCSYENITKTQTRIKTRQSMSCVPFCEL